MIARFVLPLECAPTLNRYARTHWAVRAKLKQDVLVRMLAQHGRRVRPLTGKPTIVAIRLSTKEPDADSGWTKVPLDLLKVKGGLGFILDDSPEHVTVKTLWERVPRGLGRVVIEVHE